MPPKKNADWEQWLKSVKANHPTWGAGRITRALEQRAATEGRDDAPGERWVGNFLKKLKEDPNWPKESRGYLAFYWPESMERGDLPWEASAAALECLRALSRDEEGSRPVFLQGPFFTVPGIWQHQRPTINLVRWFWRVTQAMPTMPANTERKEYLLFRWTIAEVLDFREELPSKDERLPRDLEEALVWETVSGEELLRLVKHLREDAKSPARRHYPPVFDSTPSAKEDTDEPKGQ